MNDAELRLVIDALDDAIQKMEQGDGPMDTKKQVDARSMLFKAVA